ncbi:MAG: hypothetical protein COU34_04800, partial [Candidatus Magasanikbacteria bacterium CG10_big_fil_rev_8_21_14_0_10_43_9]
MTRANHDAPGIPEEHIPNTESLPTPDTTYQQVEELLLSVPDAFRTEVEETKNIISQMVERARSVDLSAEDISAFDKAMNGIVDELKALAEKVQAQLNDIQKTQELVETGLLSQEEVSETDPEELVAFRDKMTTLMTQVSSELSHITWEKRNEGYQKQQRVTLAREITRANLESSQITVPPIPPLVPSEALLRQQAAFENAQQSNLRPDILAKATEKLRALEQKEQTAWDNEHGRDPEDSALLDSIRTALDTRTLDTVFAKKGFDTKRAVSLIAEQIREKAFSLKGISNDVLEELPEEVIKAIVDEMSDEEMWKTMREMSDVVKEKKQVSFIYASKPYKERSDESKKRGRGALETVDFFSGSDGFQRMRKLCDDWQKDPEGNSGRDVLVRELQRFAAAIESLKDSYAPATDVDVFPENTQK